GAANSPTRTVTFTRGSDVTSASVELLDEDDELLDTFPDTDDDGSVTVTLPADGSYGVRVVRSNAASQSSTSAIVAVTLDRVAPDVSNLAIGVTPEISNALERTVSFTRPADATTVVAQVIDADDDAVGLPVTMTGSSATVTVGPADGDYRVRLTLTDAAGNAADGTSDTITLDRVAPDAGPAPTVTGAGNDRQRTVTFTRDPSAAAVVVEILDADDELLDTVPVATGGSTAITLPDADATYGVRVRQTDAAGNGAATEITDAVLDRIAPDLSTLALTVTPTLSNDRARTVTIARPSDAAAVTAQVIDADDAPVGSPVTITGNTGTVTLGGADGSYRVVVTVADAAGNEDDVTSSPVTLDATAPDAGPAPTVTGDERLRERTVAFTRDPTATLVVVEILDADGDVIDTVPVPSGATASVTLPDADGDYGLRVRQSDAAGNTDTTPTADVTLDRVAPDLSGLELTVTPEISNVPERTVTIVRPADAEIVIAQVIDENDQPVGSPVVIADTTATVTLGSADRTYRVVVAVEDAAGNAAEVRSGGITLDTVAPDAGPAPTVTGGDGSRERTISFRRDAGAVLVTIEVRNAAGAVVQTVPVPTGDSATILLPDVVGTYTIRVIQTDAAGNSQVTDETTIVRSPDPVPDPTPTPTPTPTPNPGPGVPPADQSCAKPALLLTDVRRTGNRVRITGFTTRSQGTEVTIDEAGGKQVGTATVDGSGAFSATATAPRSASARDRVGYRASVEQDRSPLVRLRQVNDLRTVARSGDTVTLRGRVDVRRPSRFSAVEVYGGTGSCPTSNKRLETIGTAKIDRRTGTYTVQIRVPASERLVVKTRATIGGGNYHSTHTVSAAK
ncbi:MAG: Ig-like domain repeat protein, partial [Patulibacter sp.]